MTVGDRTSPKLALTCLVLLAAVASTDRLRAQGTPAQQALALINGARSRTGLAPLALSPVLSEVATRRAAQLSASGNLDPSLEDLRRLSVETRRLGYQSARLFEATVHGRWDATEWFAALAREHPDVAREATAGDLLDAGFGRAMLDGGPLDVLLLALPTHVVLERRLATLADLESMRSGVFAATNRARATAGVGPLSADPTLDRVAQSHATAMLSQGFYAHRDPAGDEVRERVGAAGLFPSTLGENLARGLFSPDEVVENWLLSSGHRANILSPRFRYLGIGLAYDPQGEERSVHWVQVFANEAGGTP